MTSAQVELFLTAIAAMLSPTTLTFSVLVLVLSNRPLRTGLWFYVGALGATLAIGVLAAVVLGNSAYTSSSTPKTWVLVLDVVAGAALLVYVLVWLRRPPDPQKAAATSERMTKLASSPAIAVLGAGAALANPGGFIVVALKDISQLNPSTAQYVLDWTLFALISLLPLALALVLISVRPERARRLLARARAWLDRHLHSIEGAFGIVLGGVLLYNGISGLAG